MFSARPLAVLLLFAASLMAQEAGSSASVADELSEEAIDIADLRAHLGFLASDELGGRLAGSRNERIAARYVATVLEHHGFEPAGTEGFIQPFNLGLRRVLADTSLTLVRGEELKEYRIGREFLPLILSPNARLEATPVVFVGYGIRAPEHEYDDYEGIDVTGKIVLALRGEPRSKDPDSPFDGTEMTEHSLFVTKARIAGEQGAAALLVVSGPVDHRSSIPAGQMLWPSLKSADGRPGLMQGVAELAASSGDASSSNMSATAIAEMLPRMFQSSLPEEQLAVPSLSVSRKVTNALFRGLEQDLRELQAQLDETLQSVSFEIPASRMGLSVEIGRDSKFSRNVVARLPGRDPELNGEVVVLGAHLDHVGFNDAGDIWNGADDNASGTTVLLEAAEALSRGPRPARSIMIIAFGAEEQGLLGSQYWVQHPTVPIESVVAMVNMDMVGRGESGKVTVMGGKSAELLNSWLNELDGQNGLDFLFDESADAEFFGRSDQANFYAADVPCVFLSTMLHDDYHKPTDTAEKIDFANMQRIARTIRDLALRIANDPERPVFVAYRPDPDILEGLGSVLDLGLER